MDETQATYDVAEARRIIAGQQKMAMERCWRAIQAALRAESMALSVRVFLTPDGRVAGEPFLTPVLEV